MGIWSELVLHILAKAQGAVYDTRSQRGQTLAEYGLIMTIIAVAIVGLALLAFRDVLSGAFDSVVDCLDGAC